MKILVTRPEHQARATADRLRACGHEPLVSPLLVIEPVPWTAGPRPPALIVTSANACAGSIPEAWCDVPVFALGPAAARAAEAAGMMKVATPLPAGTQRSAAALYAAVADAGVTSAVHLCGEDRFAAPVPPGLSLQSVVTYAARPRPLDPAAGDALAKRHVGWALVYSQRSAARLAAEVDHIGAHRASLQIAALADYRDSLGTGWRAYRQAARADEDALFAAAGLMCEESEAGR